MRGFTMLAVKCSMYIRKPVFCGETSILPTLIHRFLEQLILRHSDGGDSVDDLQTSMVNEIALTVSRHRYVIPKIKCYVT